MTSRSNEEQVTDLRCSEKMGSYSLQFSVRGQLPFLFTRSRLGLP
jgi:hypothetical protein